MTSAFVATPNPMGGWSVLHVEGFKAPLVAAAIDEPTAVRVAQLLDRHGLIDTPVAEVPSTD